MSGQNNNQRYSYKDDAVHLQVESKKQRRLFNEGEWQRFSAKPEMIQNIETDGN